MGLQRCKDGFTVVATNGAGSSAASSASSAVTPTSPVTYTVTYNLNGGTGSAPLDLTNYSAGTSVSLAAQSGFSRANHSFAGWSTTSTGSVISGGTVTMPSSNLTLYAKWDVTASFTGAPSVSATTNPSEITASWVFSGTTPQSFAIEWRDVSGNIGIVNPAVASNLSSITTAAPSGTYTFRMKAILDATASVFSSYSSSAVTITSAIVSVSSGNTADIQNTVNNIVVAESGTNLAAALLNNPIVQSAQVSTTTGAATPTMSIVTNAVKDDANITTAQKIDKVAETVAVIATQKGVEVTILAAAQTFTQNSGDAAVKNILIAGMAAAGIAVSAPITLSSSVAEELKVAKPNTSSLLNTTDLTAQISVGETPIIAPEKLGATIYGIIPPNTTVIVENTSGSINVNYNPTTDVLTIDSIPKDIDESFNIGTSGYTVRGKGTFMFENNNNNQQTPICFLGNAPVLTPSGYRRIDSLAVGDLVRTADGRDVAIQRVKRQRIVTPSLSVNPFVIPKGQWGATENLAISPRHCVAVPGRGMVEARFLGLRQLSLKAAFDYYNLELPEWDNMVVAGVEVESLAPKKRVVMTADKFRALIIAKGIRTEADLAKLARFVEMQADGRVAVTISRQERRIRA